MHSLDTVLESQWAEKAEMINEQPQVFERWLAEMINEQPEARHDVALSNMVQGQADVPAEVPAVVNPGKGGSQSLMNTEVDLIKVAELAVIYSNSDLPCLTDPHMIDDGTVYNLCLIECVWIQDDTGIIIAYHYLSLSHFVYFMQNRTAFVMKHKT